MTAIDQTKLIFRALTVVIACAFFTGCQSFDFESHEVAEESSLTPKAEVSGQYQMQLIPSFGNPSVEKVDIIGSVTIQDALEASGAVEKFRSMKITLGRVVKDKAALLKLPVEYEVRSKTVPDHQNYQLLPGDTVTVSPNSSGPIDQLFEKITGGII